MKFLRRLRWRYVLACVLLLGLSGAGLVYWQARQALRSARADVQAQEDLRFSVNKLTPLSNSFESINAPAAFSGAAVFQSDFYLCGASGLLRYDSHGVLLKHYRPGQELPSSPLLRMTTAVLRDAREPELLIVTESDGVL
ncbi:MAG TPA: hypothetical protein VFR24_16920, partial [Candidatus Angelobacter sp.]|nr:hypothetical protein [Candidatus Angelobacter sp.]